MTTLELDDLSIHIVRKRMKSITLRICPPDGLIKVSAPLQLNQQHIIDFIHQKKQWIHRQRERIKQQHAITAQEPFDTGSTVFFKGKPYLLIVAAHHGPKHILIKDELIYCNIHPQSSPQERALLFDAWYEREMALLIPERIAYWQQIIPVHVAQWRIKKMKTRWGSCNTRTHHISLNLNLIKKNTACLDYVLVHELVHLLEPSHNQRFYMLMSRFMPQWPDIKILLEGR